MNRRLADKLIDALETAWEQGREELAKSLNLVYQSLVEEESGIRNRRREKDDEFDAEDADSFRRHHMYEEDAPPAESDEEKDKTEETTGPDPN